MQHFIATPDRSIPVMVPSLGQHVGVCYVKLVCLCMYVYTHVYVNKSYIYMHITLSSNKLLKINYI